MKKTKLTISLLIFMAVWVFLYLVFSFVTWELNPEKWDTSARFMYAFSSSTFGALLATFPRH